MKILDLHEWTLKFHSMASNNVWVSLTLSESVSFQIKFFLQDSFDTNLANCSKLCQAFDSISSLDK